jgi:tetratricopeptide (TPR) repeat protein
MIVLCGNIFADENDDDVNEYVVFANYYLVSGQFEKVIEFCGIVIKINPDHDKAYHPGGLAYHFRGAANDYEKTLELNPGNEEYRKSFAKLSMYSESNYDYRKSIFDNLFSDIYETMDEYKHKENYLISEEFQITFPFKSLSDKLFVVQNEYLRILFFPDYENNNGEKFVRHFVYINKKTDEILLGKYIGENIETLRNEYIEKEIIEVYQDFTYYLYLNPYFGAGVIVENDIIKEIHYGR